MHEAFEKIDQTRLEIVNVPLDEASNDANCVNYLVESPLHVTPFDEPKLIEKGAVVSNLNQKDQTYLHLASAAGNFDIVRKFVSEEYNFTLPNTDDLNPLHYVVEKTTLELWDLCLKIITKSHQFSARRMTFLRCN
jgi:ankyrin repeat protein